MLDQQAGFRTAASSITAADRTLATGDFDIEIATPDAERLLDELERSWRTNRISSCERLFDRATRSEIGKCIFDE